MAKRTTPSKNHTAANDSLSDFVSNMAHQATGVMGGAGAYRDSPLSGYAKDAWQVYGNLYNGNWLVKAAVDTIPEDCFKKGYQWVAPGDQVNLLEAEERRHRVRHKKQQALTWARLDGEAYIYMDTGQVAAKESRPDAVGQGGLRFVNVLRRDRVTKGPVVRDPMSPYFGQPEYYQIGTARIHPSRIIRFVNAPDPDSGDGVSVLSYMMQPIIASDTARDNVVALTTEAAMDIISVCGLSDEVSTPEGAAAVARRYQLFRQGKATNRLGILDKDSEEYHQHQRSFATLPEVIETMRREVAASIGIPYSLLFGRPGGLGTNGETELQVYYGTIATMQANEIQPVCEPLDDMVIRSALGSRPDDVWIDWLPLYEDSQKEIADTAKVLADAANVIIKSGILPADVLSEPTVNAMTELGAFQGIEQAYQDFISGGGWDATDPAIETQGVPEDGDDDA